MFELLEQESFCFLRLDNVVLEYLFLLFGNGSEVVEVVAGLIFVAVDGLSQALLDQSCFLLFIAKIHAFWFEAVWRGGGSAV